MIDWTRIKTIEDVLRLDEYLLFDESEVSQPSDMLKLNPNLTEEEMDDAFFWKDYSRGLMLVTGEPGNGKGIFSHMVSKKMGYYFDKVPIIDTRPRKSFGTYIPFSEDFLGEQVDRMSEMESNTPRPYIVKGLTEIDFQDEEGLWEEYKALPPLEQYKELQFRGIVPREAVLQEYNKRKNEFTATVEFKPFVDNEGKWITSRGEVFLRNSTLLMDEFGNKYMGRLSSPTLGIKQVLLKLFNFWRHMHCLMLGVGVDLEDFDRKCLPKATWEARCVYVRDADEQRDNPETIIIGVYLTPIKFNPSTDELTRAGASTRLRINASEPKHMLDGLAWKDIYNTDNAQGFELPSKMRRRQ